MSQAGKLKDRVEEIESLVVLVKNGDKEAFAKLYDIFIDPVYRYVFFRVKNEEAEDLVENIFVKIWEHIRKYRADEKKLFVAWVFRIAHNTVIDFYRSLKHQKHEDLDPNLADSDRRHNPVRSTQQVLDRQVLALALGKVKSQYREVIIQKFLNGFSNQELVGIFGKSEGNLRILQFRALKALKVVLKDLGVHFDRF